MKLELLLRSSFKKQDFWPSWVGEEDVILFHLHVRADEMTSRDTPVGMGSICSSCSLLLSSVPPFKRSSAARKLNLAPSLSPSIFTREEKGHCFSLKWIFRATCPFPKGDDCYAIGGATPPENDVPSRQNSIVIYVNYVIMLVILKHLLLFTM